MCGVPRGAHRSGESHHSGDGKGCMMPCEITWEPRGLYRKLYGTVSFQEIIASIESAGADPRFDDLRYSVNDFSEMQGSEVTFADVESIAAVLYGQSQTNARILIAIVTTDETAHALVERLSWLNIAPYLMQTFPDVAKARAWIAGAMPQTDTSGALQT
jgi:hypothetical protein